MQQTPMERWLEEQHAPSDIEHHAHDIWYVCSSLSLVCPDSEPISLLALGMMM